jgi:outer membrane protein TolC
VHGRLLVALCLTGALLGSARRARADDPQLPAAPAAAPAKAEGAAAGAAAKAGEMADAAGRVLRLSLKRALEMGAGSALDVQASAYDAPVAQQARLAAEASFDRLLTAGVTATHQETPSTNLFLGSGVITDNSFDLQVGVSRRLRNGGTLSLLYTADRTSTSNPFATVDPAYDQGLTLEATRPLLRGAGDVALADIRRAQNQVASAQAGYHTQVETTLLSVADAYWELVFADDNLDARRKALEVAKELLDDAHSRLAAEVGTPLDVADARAGVERRRSDLLEAGNLRETVQDRLLSMILPFGPHVRPEVHVMPTDHATTHPETLPTRRDEQRYVDLAMQGRPELLGSRAEIANAGIDVLVARDAIRPQLDVVGRLGEAGLDSGLAESLKDIATGRAITGSIGLEFSLYIGQRAARADWLAAAWRRRQALVRRRELQNQIVVEVRGALRDLDTARAQLGAASAEVAAGEEALRGERLKLAQGKSTPFQVLQKESDLTDARTRRGRAAADLSIAEARLHHAVGGLAAAYGIQTRRWPACAPACSPTRR